LFADTVSAEAAKNIELSFREHQKINYPKLIV